MVKSKPYTPDFERFWCTYPSRWQQENNRWVKRLKYPAFLEFDKLPTSLKVKCLEIAEGKLIPAGKGTPDACRWIKNREYDDFSDFAVNKAAQNARKRTTTAQDSKTNASPAYLTPAQKKAAYEAGMAKILEEEKRKLGIK